MALEKTNKFLSGKRKDEQPKKVIKIYTLTT